MPRTPSPPKDNGNTVATKTAGLITKSKDGDKSIAKICAVTGQNITGLKDDRKK